MNAELIYDNAVGKLTYPIKPGAHQMQGSNLENLAEFSGRICYDSVGEKGRGSADYHANVLSMQHRSIYEHCVFTIPWNRPLDALMNRPSLYWRPGRATINLRHALEWPDEYVRSYAAYVAPNLFPLETPREPLSPDDTRERWLSFYITGVSRNLTHELVRHGDWTGISQRSTRFCDESESPIAWHPLMDVTNAEWYADLARSGYRLAMARLRERGVPLKQARGAARGLLPSALSTSLVFSASVEQWRHILRLRGASDADQEIQNLSGIILDKVPWLG